MPKEGAARSALPTLLGMYGDLRDWILAQIRAALPFVRDGKFDLSSPNIVGEVPPPRGGTGTTDGTATPKDDSVTDAKIAAGANIDPAKLDAAKLAETVQDIVGAFVTAGAGVTVTYDDAAATLTIASTASGGSGVPVPPDTYAYIVDSDGAYIVDSDGAYLWEPIA